MWAAYLWRLPSPLLSSPLSSLLLLKPPMHKQSNRNVSLMRADESETHQVKFAPLKVSKLNRGSKSMSEGEGEEEEERGVLIGVYTNLQIDRLVTLVIIPAHVTVEWGNSAGFIKTPESGGVVQSTGSSVDFWEAVNRGLLEVVDRK